MSILNILILLALAGGAGIGIGYYLRFIISLGQRGSAELQIRKMMLDAEERSKKITETAEQEAKEKGERLAEEYKERERDLKQTEERLVGKEDLLDKRHAKLELDQDALAKKNEEAAAAKARADELTAAQEKKLEQVAGLSADEAKQQLLTGVEKRSESCIAWTTKSLHSWASEGSITGTLAIRAR